MEAQGNEVRVEFSPPIVRYTYPVVASATSPIRDLERINPACES